MVSKVLVFICLQQIAAVVLANYHDSVVKNHKNLRLLPKDNQCGRSSLLERKPVRTRIIWPNFEARPGDFPWMAYLYYKHSGKEQFMCGGSIINNRYVITAAHCFDFDPPQPSWKWYIRVGEADRTKNCTGGSCAVYTVEEISFPGKYVRDVLMHDIALLRLTKEIKFSGNVSPVCLPLKPYGDLTGLELTVAGWGYMSFAYPDVLRYNNVPVQSNEMCLNAHKPKGPNRRYMKKNVICAGDKRDSCNGDSGGPLMLNRTNVNGIPRYFLVGVVSYGQDCHDERNPKIPGVYTNVYSFLPWILKTIY